ncbi:nucleotide-binding protein [Thiolapillus sp.]
MITVIGSLKGGSGKSTIAFNLAVWLALGEQNVLAIDADPQATLTDVVDVRTEEGFEPPVRLGSKELLENRRELDRYEEVLIDVGTADLASLKLAIKVADRIVVPVPPSQADIWSTQRFLRLIDSVVGNDRRPEVMGFINRGDTHRAVRESDEAAAALIALPGIKFIKSRLAQRTAFRRSFSEGLGVFEMDPRSKGANEWNALAAVLYAHVVS